MCSLKTISYKKMPNVHVTRNFRDNNDINNEEIFCILKKRDHHNSSTGKHRRIKPHAV